MTVDPEKALVLWPSYFDSKVSLREGRKVPRADATEVPTAQMVYEAVKALGLDCILELEKGYPRFWHRKEGRVLVEPRMTKPELLSKVAAKLKSVPRQKQ